MIYTVTLNPALDYVMRLPQLRQGEVNRAHSEEIQLGGKGINVSRVLSELGEASTALGFIAGFTGDALQQGLRAMGLHTDFVRLKRGATRINVKLKAQGETDINATGPAVDETALAALLRIGGDSFTLEAINDNLKGCGLNAVASETETPGVVEVRFPDVPGIPDGFESMRAILEDILPCHLDIRYVYWYITWALMEERFDTWGDIEAISPTWEELEKMVQEDEAG